MNVPNNALATKPAGQPGHPGQQGPGLLARLSVPGDWTLLRPVLVFHLMTRAAIIAGLVLASVLSGRPFPAVVTRWDGRWYSRLALHGYPSHLPTGPAGRIKPSTAGFFLLYPLLTRVPMSLGIPFWLSGMMINFVASTVAVLIIVLVGREYLDRHAAVMLGCLWTAFPISAVLTTTYTEATFTVFAAASLLFVLRRRWVAAGLAAALAGAVRSPGIVFAGAVGLGALEAIIRRREWRSLIGAALAPLGFLASIAYIGIRTGTPNAWSLTEHGGWHVRLTFGRGWLSFLQTPPSSPHNVLHLVTGLVVIALMVLTIAAVVLRPPVPIIVLVVVGAFTAFAFGGVEMDSAPRVMMSFFPVLAPLAILLSRCPGPVRWALLGLGSIAAAVVGGYYFAYAPISP